MSKKSGKKTKTKKQAGPPPSRIQRQIGESVAEKRQPAVTELQIEDQQVGTGTSPQAGDICVMHYTGWLTDGTKFDSSVDRGRPFEFMLGRGQVIQGWDHGVATMKVGGKRKLTIPPHLGYGARGAGSAIPPHATLVFEVELLDVKVLEPLKIEDIEVGDGPSPQTGRPVTVQYTGTLADGTPFDSSLDRGEPFQFVIGVGQVIPGWDQGVATMKVGGKRKLIIPPHLGYGARGVGGVIPPNATLHFDLELLAVD